MGRVGAVLVLLLALLMPGTARAKDIVADLVMHRIEITSGFSGAELTLFGAVNEKGDAVAVVRGPTAPGGGLIGGTVEVRQKTRTLGIWMTGAHVRFENVPGFYAIAASRPLEEILTFDMLDRYQLGINELKLPAVSASAPNISDYAGALRRIRQNLGLYAAKVGHISFIGDRLFRTSFTFPSTVPTGIYNVDVYLVRDGKIVDAQNMPLIISKVGFGADIYKYAHANSIVSRLVYGIVAVFVAFLTGWFAHLAFRKR
jgi:uncharacterized protein (TIGR02186 family)